MDSVPKTMKVKAKKLMDRLKTQLSWTDRGELIHGGTPVPGSNMVDLVNDVLQKRRKRSCRMASVRAAAQKYQPTHGIGR